MQRQQYGEAFREQAVRKVLERGDRTIQSVAEELGVGLMRLKDWVKQTRRRSRAVEAPGLAGAQAPTAAQRLELLLASAGLSGEALQAWCRQRGVYAHQLSAWKAAFAQEGDGGAVKPLKAERDALKAERDGLKRQLHKRDKALAEAAALLVLSKKFQALLGEADE
jgi:transposase-like protein